MRRRETERERISLYLVSFSLVSLNTRDTETRRDEEYKLYKRPGESFRSGDSRATGEPLPVSVRRVTAAHSPVEVLHRARPYCSVSPARLFYPPYNPLRVSGSSRFNAGSQRLRNFRISRYTSSRDVGERTN